jgi:hypothetical protein
MSFHEFQNLKRAKTPLGMGYIWYVETGNDDNWYTVILDNGAIVTFNQSRIRIARSYTLKRGINDEEMKDIIK